jgi:uncharacterized membrane protein
MTSETAIDLIARRDWLERTAGAVQPVVVNTFEAGGTAGRKIKDFLHGSWFGHPLHPAITDVPLGAWTVALVFDLMAEGNKRKEFARASETAVVIGLIGAVGSAVTGLTDWSDTGGRARRVGMMHGLLNAGATALYGASLWLRRRERRRAGRHLAYLGYTASMAAAYLGGHLVFRILFYKDQRSRDFGPNRCHTRNRGSAGSRGAFLQPRNSDAAILPLSDTTLSALTS